MPDYRQGPSSSPSSEPSEPKTSPAQDESPRGIGELSGEDMPLALYEAERRRPFVADFLELGNYYRESGAVQEVSKVVGDFALEEIARRGWEKTTEATKRVLEELSYRIDGDGVLPQPMRLEKIKAVIHLLRAERKLRSFDA